jgi:hypothetical protein
MEALLNLPLKLQSNPGFAVVSSNGTINVIGNQSEHVA